MGFKMPASQFSIKTKKCILYVFIFIMYLIYLFLYIIGY